MKVITKYQAFDGTEHLEENKCVEHESNCKLADLIINKLPEKPSNCDFSNGGGYIQHDFSSLLSTRNEFLEFCKRYTTFRWIQETIDGGFDVDSSWAGRIIDESAPNYISKIWHRFSCIDDQLREWGQPYYAANPGTGKPKQINLTTQRQ